jgi:hypothetical protein
MTEPTNPTTPEEPTPDETFTWTAEGDSPAGAHGATGDAGEAGPAGQSGAAAAGATATAILESLREAVDDLAERATPTVREFSARAAELAAVAADRAAPLVRRAGEVTSDASGKLATKSRHWAADVRASMAADDAPAAAADAADEVVAPPPTTSPDAESAPTDDPTPG